MTYGSIAEWLEQGSPRLVARVMSTKSDPETPWQRVLRADGTCAPQVAAEQLNRLEAEGAAFLHSTKGGKKRVDLALAYWTPSMPTASPTGRQDDVKTKPESPEGVRHRR